MFFNWEKFSIIFIEKSFKWNTFCVQFAAENFAEKFAQNLKIYTRLIPTPTSKYRSRCFERARQTSNKSRIVITIIIIKPFSIVRPRRSPIMACRLLSAHYILYIVRERIWPDIISDRTYLRAFRLIVRTRQRLLFKYIILWRHIIDQMFARISPEAPDRFLRFKSMCRLKGFGLFRRFPINYEYGFRTVRKASDSITIPA